MKRKDGTHLLFMGLIAATLVISIAVFVNVNNRAHHEARTKGYSNALPGRGSMEVSPDKGFMFPLILITLVVVVGLVAWWVYELRRIDAHNAKTSDVPLLNSLFRPGQNLVSYQIKPGTMSHAVIVAGAKERGYILTSQGHDGSLVFEPYQEGTD